MDHYNYEQGNGKKVDNRDMVEAIQEKLDVWIMSSQLLYLLLKLRYSRIAGKDKVMLIKKL